MNILFKFAIIALLASAYSNTAHAAEKTEATPGALDKIDGMKKHEKDLRNTREATPERGKEMREQGNDAPSPK